MNPTETLAPDQGLEWRSKEAVSKDVLARMSSSAAEPEFLARRRAEAWAFCEKTPFPNRLEELWRRTDISGLKWDAIAAIAPAPAAVRSLDSLPAFLREEIGPASERSAILVQVDSGVVWEASMIVEPKR